MKRNRFGPRRLAGLDAQQDVVGGGVGAAQVVAVVGGDDGGAGLGREAGSGAAPRSPGGGRASASPRRSARAEGLVLGADGLTASSKRPSGAGRHLALETPREAISPSACSRRSSVSMRGRW